MNAATFFFDYLFLSIVFVMPIGFCNMGANWFGVLFKKFDLAIPMDGGKNLKDGRRLFGDHKTWPGFIGGIVLGTIVGIVIWYLNVKYSFLLCRYPWFIGILMSFGDHSADLLGSYIKRRRDIPSGGSLPLYDQGSWMVTGLIPALPFALPVVWYYYVIPIVITPVLHVLAGFLAVRLKLKDVWY